jgi:DHA1 family bicyclomycin/chloramphenicol resistance-like MFS transporter
MTSTTPPARSRFQLSADTLAMTATLAMLTSLGPLSTDMYLPALPAIAEGLGSTIAGAQLTLSAFLLGFACGQFLYGPVSDRIGRKPVLSFGLGLFLVATIACIIAPNIETLTLARFVQAFGASAPIVLARAIVRDLYEGARAGRELSRMGTIMGLVPAIAPVLGGVIHVAFGWRAVFVAILIAGIVLTIVVLRHLPETLRRRETAPLSLKAILAGFALLLRHPTYRFYAGLSALTYSGLFAFISGSSFVLQGVYGLSELAYGFSFGFVVIGFIGGTLIAQRIVSSRGLDGTIGLGVLCLAGGGSGMLVLSLVSTGSALEVVLPMALYGVGVGLTMPQCMASALTPFPERAGAASSLLGIIQMSLAALVGIGLGAALIYADIAMATVLAALGILAALLFVTSRRIRREVVQS